MYVTLSDTAHHYGVTKMTIRRWSKSGKIGTITTPGHQHKYWIVDDRSDKIATILQTPDRYQAIYARVSTARQKEDLTRQIAYLKTKYPSGVVFSDIASSLNYSRKNLQRLLSEVLLGRVSCIAISHKDRIARFGFDFIKWLCGKYNTDIVVDSRVSIHSSIEQELVEDLLSCTHSFSGKLYRSRVGKSHPT